MVPLRVLKSKMTSGSVILVPFRDGVILKKRKDRIYSFVLELAIIISKLSSASVSKRVQVRNLSYENEFVLQLN